MRLVPILQVLALLVAANSTPLFLGRLWKGGRAVRLDHDLRLGDGQPMFGPSKTWPGIVSAIAASAIVAALAGFPAWFGALAGLAAMLGDLFSSFVKRRLGLPAGAMALGLDQIPESLFPSLVMALYLPLTAMEIAAIVSIFLAGELLLSRLLFYLHLRDRPY